MNEKRAWLYDLLLVAVLLVAAYFRVIGLNWDQGQHLHPDERFLTMVESALQPVKSLSEYFNTNTSTLNPHNQGYGFFVYGDLPVVIVRYIAGWLGQTGYDQVNLVGRQVSALADLGVILLLYAIAARLYGRKIGLLAAAFSAVTVMQIQQSHFFTVDNPANFFAYLATYFAVLILVRNPSLSPKPGGGETQESAAEEAVSAIPAKPPTNLSNDRLFWLSIAFGVALGMAVASKLSAAPMAVMLPIALFLYYRGGKSRKDWNLTNEQWTRLIVYLIAGGLASIIAFRIFQPYAFNGLGLNEKWMTNIRDLEAQSSGDVDVPFALQWARRTHLYSLVNMVKYGFGLPLGILVWIGFLWMGWRILKGEWRHILLWSWTGAYFIWQSMVFNPTMRYQLPIYPLLSMMAAWFVFEGIRVTDASRKKTRILNYGLRVLGALVLLATLAWAYAFTRIYTRTNTRVAATEWIYQNLPGPINLHIDTGNGVYHQPLPFPADTALQVGVPYYTSFAANAGGTLTEIYLPHVTQLVQGTDAQNIMLTLSLTPDAPADQTLGTASVSQPPSTRPGGAEYTFKFSKPITFTKGTTYFLRIDTTGQYKLAGAAPINESSWDDGLPLRMDGYDGYGGLYTGGLNLEMYFDDNPDKLNRFVTTLDQGDYLFMSSNRQWATIPRVPERYPLSTEYYRLLLGCPPDKDIIWCYNVAKPGQFKGQLGYDLVKVFESYPTIGPLTINDQFAEEAFTVYDHTKVLIFKKSSDFDVTKVQSLLGAVDLSNVVHLTPKQASNYKDLMLPLARLVQDRANGTWIDLFNYNWLQNKYPVVGLVIWYAFIFLLGLAAYPVTRLALSGLGQYAYPLSRIVGIVLLAWFSWMGGSLGVPYTRASIGAAAVIIVVIGLSLWLKRKEEFKDEWNAHRRFFVIVEILFLAFFLIDLLIRFGNSDLWHPSKGGERPMDFSYFNAVLKSESFPPYDPWFAGGYINYYYYGYVLAGSPVKLLGIVPSIAYNFILPTWFAMVGIGAFTIVFSLVENLSSSSRVRQLAPFDIRLISGLAASFMTVLLGNLGTVRLLFNGFQRIAAPGGIVPDSTTFVQKWIWAIRGLWMSFGGSLLPIGRGDWYWFPSRVIPAPNDVEPITEFPLFTFLYSDLHAHMLVMPITLFIIAWAVSFIKSRARMNRSEWLATFVVGGLMVGALKPTNTWDLYTYFPLAALAVIYTLYRYPVSLNFRLPAFLGGGDGHESSWFLRVAIAIGAALFLYVFGTLLYWPFSYWYSQAYGQIQPWWGSHTPLSSYFTQWGLFLFIIVAWMAWETREWMAATPVSHLKKLSEYTFLFEIGLAAILAFLAFFAVKGIRVGWLALPLAVWAGILILRPDMPDLKRGVLMMVGTALVLTMAVEEFVLVGDIGRMNTVFKLYLQSWMLFAVSAAAAFGWLLNVFPSWRLRWRTVYQTGVYVLLAGTFLFTLTATTDKISDRMTPTAPHTLDSMTYMAYSQLWDGQTMDLSQDYNAIRWMQDNVKGSPVIVEANCTEYRWCTRFTVYTGLPGVVGWNFHQRQQRALMPPNLITDRIAEIGEFYATTDINAALSFLKKYQVKYIIVGQLERNIYPNAVEGGGFNKFEQYNGKYWNAVYRDRDTVVYEVLP